jgi:hypothetical protein
VPHFLSAIDITAQGGGARLRESELRLRESEARFRAFMPRRYSPPPRDCGTAAVEVNDAFMRWVGLARRHRGHSWEEFAMAEKTNGDIAAIWVCRKPVKSHRAHFENLIRKPQRGNRPLEVPCLPPGAAVNRCKLMG